MCSSGKTGQTHGGNTSHHWMNDIEILLGFWCSDRRGEFRSCGRNRCGAPNYCECSSTTTTAPTMTITTASTATVLMANAPLSAYARETADPLQVFSGFRRSLLWLYSIVCFGSGRRCWLRWWHCRAFFMISICNRAIVLLWWFDERARTDPIKWMASTTWILFVVEMAQRCAMTACSQATLRFGAWRSYLGGRSAEIQCLTHCQAFKKITLKKICMPLIEPSAVTKQGLVRSDDYVRAISVSVTDQGSPSTVAYVYCCDI